MHPNGKFVYGSNRGDNNIAVFSIDATTGMVTLVEHTSTQGMTPRNFTIDPSGKFLYAANQNSNTVVPFAIDATTGRLTPTATADHGADAAVRRHRRAAALTPRNRGQVRWYAPTSSPSSITWPAIAFRKSSRLSSLRPRTVSRA